jgi:hypothetical protein
MNEICTEKIEERLCNSDVDLFGNLGTETCVMEMRRKKQ